MVLRLVLLAALGWAMAGNAQQTPTRTPAPKGARTSQVNPVVQGKRRGITRDQRMAAAVRNTERKLAAGQKNQAVQPEKRGVRQ